MDARPKWNPMDMGVSGKFERSTPNFIQPTIIMPIGTKQRPVKAVDTSWGGLTSGSLNRCRISGLGLLRGKAPLTASPRKKCQNKFKIPTKFKHTFFPYQQGQKSSKKGL